MPTLESFDQLLVIHNAHFIIDTKFVNLELHKIEKVTSWNTSQSELKSRMWEKIDLPRFKPGHYTSQEETSSGNTQVQDLNLMLVEL